MVLRSVFIISRLICDLQFRSSKIHTIVNRTANYLNWNEKLSVDLLNRVELCTGSLVDSLCPSHNMRTPNKIQILNDKAFFIIIHQHIRIHHKKRTETICILKIYKK